MFNEVLRIKPILDTATTKQMENNLSARFNRVAHRFGAGLKSVIKGSVLGISLGLLNKILNPIEAIEEKIKGLLGQSSDISDLAERFNTSPGELKQLQDVAQSVGVSPEDFKSMLTKYAEAVETAREELKNPFGEISGKSLAVKQFAGEENLAKGFSDFLASLKGAGQGSGGYAALSDRAKRRLTGASMTGEKISDDEIQDLLRRGEIKKQTGLEQRKGFEKEIFGDAQFGASQRLIQTNIPAAAASLKIPSTDKVNEAINKASQIAAQKRALDATNQSQDFLNASNKLTSKMGEDMANAERLEAERLTDQITSYEDLRKAANGIENLKVLLTEATSYAAKGVGYLGELTAFMGGLKNSKLFTTFLGRKD